MSGGWGKGAADHRGQGGSHWIRAAAGRSQAKEPRPLVRERAAAARVSGALTQPTAPSQSVPPPSPGRGTEAAGGREGAPRAPEQQNGATWERARHGHITGAQLHVILVEAR